MKIWHRLTLLLVSACLVAAADLSGTWTGVIPARNNELQDLTFRFVQNGETLTGKMYRDTTGVPIIDGKISGDRISFTVISDEQVGNLFVDIKYMFTGSIKGSEIELTRERAANPVLNSNNPANRINLKPTFTLKRLF